MLITSMFSLKYINVAMVTILKNVTNVITAVGEMYLFKKHHGGKVWASLSLMIVSAVSGGVTDLAFHGVGYAWQILNCFLTASYSLTLRRVMDTAKQVTKSGSLNEFSMVLLNNSLSLPLGLLLVFIFGEVDYLSKTPLLKMPMFWFVITCSGFLGLAISFTSMWFLHQTGATTYSLVGSLNKIPLSLAGILLFKVPTSLQNFLSIIFGLLAGILFARAKIK
ncbi:golgi nucleotide sugar transporter 1 isoform X4 [Wolffia australiana]